ncbi:permease-like cell division protein FtsX [Nonomuraea sp. 3N208]|uniref:permease-like cell division protein FtsX n=1 Tax=Nonomuraea sp. 3N208 TaxID=3457421 RepID=UPI003FCD7355
MNSPVEDRLRKALTEAGATIDPTTLRPLRAPERRRFRVDLRLVAVAAVVVFAGAATAVGLGGAGSVDHVVATGPEPAQSDRMEISVFLCSKSAPKKSPCQGRNVSPEEVKTIEAKVKSLPPVESVSFIDQATAYRAFRADFAHNKAVLDSVEITDLPASFRLQLKKSDAEAVHKTLNGMPGIQSVANRATSQEEESLRSLQEPKVSVFLCDKRFPEPTCDAERETHGKNDIITKNGKETTKAQKAAIRKLIDAMPEVESYVFEDQQMAYEKFRREFSENKTLLKATEVKDMREAFRLLLKPGSEPAEVVGELKRQPGVGSVVYQPCLADKAMLLTYGLSLPQSKVCPVSE